MSFSYQILIMVCFYCFNKQSNITREQFMLNYNLYMNECLKPDVAITELMPSSSLSATTSSRLTSKSNNPPGAILTSTSISTSSSQLTTTTNININLNECFSKNAQNGEILKSKLFDKKLIELIETVVYSNHANNNYNNRSMIVQDFDDLEYGEILNNFADNYDNFDVDDESEDNDYFMNNLDHRSNSTTTKKNYITTKRNHKYSNSNKKKISNNDLTDYAINSNVNKNDNVNMNEEDKNTKVKYGVVTMTFLIILYALTVTLSISGNLLVIIVMCCGFRSSFLDIRIYLINLSIFNLLMSIFCIPFTFVNALLGKWVFQSFLCPFTNFVQLLSVNGCVFTLAVLAINRFLAVAYPLKYNSNKTNSQKRRDIIVVWTCSFAFSFIQLFIYKCVRHEVIVYTNHNSYLIESTTLSTFSFLNEPNKLFTASYNDTQLKNNLDLSSENNKLFNLASKGGYKNYQGMNYTKKVVVEYICKEIWHQNKMTSSKYYLLYTVWIFVETYFAPVIILIIMYSRIICILWNRNFSSNYFQEYSGRLDQIQHFKSRTYKTIRMLFVVIVTFALNWLPIHAFHLYLAAAYYYKFDISFSKKSMTVYYFFCHWLSMSNSFINPIIYSFMNQRFKVGY
jgi:hypothetical protein